MEKETLQWHPVFCAAMEVELEGVEGIQFHREYNLARKPLQVDIVIVDEEKEEESRRRKRKGLAGILRRYNIVEYKSPDDTLSVDDFYKATSYAGLFKSESPREDGIKAHDIAIILVSSQRPLKLLKYLRDYCSMRVEEKEKGIYECEGNWIFKTYVVIAHPRYGGSYPWLNSLSKDLGTEDRKGIGKLLEEADEKKDGRRDAILELVLRANPEMARKMKEDNDMRAIQVLFEPELAAAEERAEKRGEERGEKRGEKRGQNYKLVSLVCRKLRKGKRTEVIAEDLEEDLNLIKIICQAAERFAPGYEEEKVFMECSKVLENQ